MRDYRENPPTAEDIYTHLLFMVCKPTFLLQVRMYHGHYGIGVLLGYTKPQCRVIAASKHIGT